MMQRKKKDVKMIINYKTRVEILEMFLFSSMSREDISEKLGISKHTVTEIVNKFHRDGDCVVVKSKINNQTKILANEFKKRFSRRDLVTRHDILIEFDCTHKMCTSITDRMLKKGTLKRHPNGFIIVKDKL